MEGYTCMPMLKTIQQLSPSKFNCAWKGFYNLQFEASFRSFHAEQISFTSNSKSFQIFSLEFNFWPSHQSHSHMIRLTIFIYWLNRYCLGFSLINIYIYRVCNREVEIDSLSTRQSVRFLRLWFLVERSDITFQRKYLKGIGCEWDPAAWNDFKLWETKLIKIDIIWSCPFCVQGEKTLDKTSNIQ